MGEYTLNVKNLCKVIGKKEIVKGVTFALKKGEIFGFLGPNGAGKTTTIRMLVGLIQPTEGVIEICGIDRQTHFSEAMKNIGCIVENPELYPFLTGWENLRHFAVMLPDLPQDRIDDVVRIVGLETRIHDRVRTYSLGMRQRLGIAQALLGKPKVLILDEPTNGLDPAGIREMREFIRHLASVEGMSVFVSSHLLSEIQLMCDRVAIINHGELIRVENVQGLFAGEEQMVWRLSPREMGKKILQEMTTVNEVDEDCLITPFVSEEVSVWNMKLVEAGVMVHEMTRRFPTLEDLFLRWTGGKTSDISNSQ